MMEHRFGGPWTEIKLDAVEYYLECYTRALKSVGFDLWYVDAFAGTGDREEERETGGILEGTPIETVVETMAGSARRALAIAPPFDHFHFNEQKPDRYEVLCGLKNEFPDRHIVVTAEDANQLLSTTFSRRPWLSGANSKTRGVVFLDPYALQVEWKTLELLAGTKAVDVWYLFPLRDITRQLAHQRSGIGPKERRMDIVLSEKWRELYSLPPPEKVLRQTELFGPSADHEDEERNASQRQIEQWFKELLATKFPYVSDPLPLLTGRTRQAFSLFLCVANPSPKATELARHFHSHVMKSFAAAASRRRSGP